MRKAGVSESGVLAGRRSPDAVLSILVLPEDRAGLRAKDLHEEHVGADDDRIECSPTRVLSLSQDSIQK
jgi:hypothetical protein